MPRVSKTPTEEKGFFEPYSHYARTLRTWFVAYGIGGPAVIITHPDALSVVSKAGYAGMIGWLFMTGVTAQVIVALGHLCPAWHLECYDRRCDLFSYRSYAVTKSFSTSRVVLKRSRMR